MRLQLQYPPTAEHAASHAELFVQAATRAAGVELDFSQESLVVVDEILEDFRFQGVASDDMGEMVLAVGFYLGQVFVQQGQGAWRSAEGTPFVVDWPLIELGPKNWCDPIGKAFKRMDAGYQDSLSYFYAVFTGKDSQAHRWHRLMEAGSGATQRGQLEAANPWLERALAEASAAQRAETLLLLATLRMRQERCEEAGTALAEARELLAASDDAELLARCWMDSGTLARTQGHLEEADEHFRSALRAIERLGPPGEWLAGECALLHGALLVELERFEEAEQRTLRARSIFAREPEAAEAGLLDAATKNLEMIQAMLRIRDAGK